MNFRSVINWICGILGCLVIIFGIVVEMGFLNVDSSRGMTPIVLGAIILIWSVYSEKRRK